jgi:hypothetical protein
MDSPDTILRKNIDQAMDSSEKKQQKLSEKHIENSDILQQREMKTVTSPMHLLLIPHSSPISKTHVDGDCFKGAKVTFLQKNL